MKPKAPKRNNLVNIVLDERQVGAVLSALTIMQSGLEAVRDGGDPGGDSLRRQADCELIETTKSEILTQIGLTPEHGEIIEELGQLTPLGRRGLPQ